MAEGEADDPDVEEMERLDADKVEALPDSAVVEEAIPEETVITLVTVFVAKDSEAKVLALLEASASVTTVVCGVEGEDDVGTEMELEVDKGVETEVEVVGADEVDSVP